MKSKKITVEVLCPALPGKYDFVLDNDIRAGEAAKKISEEIIQFERAESCKFDEGSMYLFTDTSQLPLDPEVSLSECGICSGSRLMLI